jgi:hypothetical protein
MGTILPRLTVAILPPLRPPPLEMLFDVRFPIAAHQERMAELAALGVDQFAIYVMHDQKEETLEADGREIIPP